MADGRDESGLRELRQELRAPLDPWEQAEQVYAQFGG